MKKIFSTLLFTLLFSSTIFAHRPASVFTLKQLTHQPILIEFDHVRYTSNDNEFRLDNLQPGTHYISIAAMHNNGYYGTPSCPEIIYRGAIDIPIRSTVKSVLTCDMLFKIVCVEPRNDGFSEDFYHHHHHEMSYDNGCQEPTYVAPAPAGMNCERFDALKATMASRNFESTRIVIAKQAISCERINTVQLSQLMQLLTFESSKLDLAKFAYNYTVDPQNYFRLDNEFAFESSVTDLTNYIQYHS